MSWANQLHPPRTSTSRKAGGGLGLSDIVENAPKAGRKVCFLVGNLGMLEETRSAWAWSVFSIIHSDDEITFVHVRPEESVPAAWGATAMLDREGGVNGALHVKPQNSPGGSWLPSFIVRDLAARKFLAHKAVMLKAPPDTHPGPLLARFIEEKGMDMAIMGSRDLAKVEQIVLGSTSKFLVNNAPCPCVCTRRLPPASTKWLPSRPRNVLIALDDNLERSQFLMQWSISNCLLIDDMVTVVSCTKSSGERAKRRNYLAKLASTVQTFQRKQKPQDQPEASTMVEVLDCGATGLKPGPLLAALVQDARPKVDLMIIGTRGHSELKKLVLGSVSSYILDHVSNCPVAVVKKLR
mmetsp:Transcript_6237/g.15175  ORF Transcript_6237/g.15175 Transcript_6237/m.15175 type:complete len:352 (+) Transcript_6237:85-1140(+)